MSMKRFISVFIVFSILSSVSAQPYVKGKVKVVNSFPDYKVKVVSSSPDLKVQAVNHPPTRDGEWQFVESFEDFSIQFVNSFEDFSIQFVDAFPGLPGVQSSTRQADNSNAVAEIHNGVGNVRSSGIRDWKNPVPDLSVKEVNGRYYFSVPRYKDRWFPTKARVQIVDSLADLKVEETYSTYANLKIIRCDSVPSKEMNWQFVDSAPDFTIQYVSWKEGNADIRVFYYPVFLERPNNLEIMTREKMYFVPQ